MVFRMATNVLKQRPIGGGKVLTNPDQGKASTSPDQGKDKTIEVKVTVKGLTNQDFKDLVAKKAQDQVEEEDQPLEQLVDQPTQTQIYTRPKQVCKRCGYNGHAQKDCQVCYNCFKRTKPPHNAGDCEESEEDLKCFNCNNKSNRYGIPNKAHHTWNCPLIRCRKDGCNGRHADMHHGNVPCKDCGLPTHTVTLCAEEACKHCGSFQHWVDDCVQCAKCEQWGHTDKFCNVKVCDNCKDIGHVKWECPDAHCDECEAAGVDAIHIPGDRKKCSAKSSDKEAEAEASGDPCERCSRFGHDESNCKTSKCILCKQFGHTAFGCKSYKLLAYCNFCGENGHLSWDKRAPCYSYNARNFKND